MMLRFLNARIPRNIDISKSFRIRAACIYPKSVNFEWEDSDSRRHGYAVSEKELEIFPDCINRQMENWARHLFELSLGRLSLDCQILASTSALTGLEKNRKGAFRLTASLAARQITPDDNLMLYIFWIPKWNDHLPFGNISGIFNGPGQDFGFSSITVYTRKNRLEDPNGWIKLDSGLPHEFWHYFRYLARETSTNLPMPSDDERGRPGWEQLKWELALQGLPVPPYAHEEQYSNVLTWRFIEKLRQKCS
jgi:hypothetical protein